ncbi:MAG: hypothetical protein WD336_03680 [Trueperaceae bacterium]
MPETPEQLTLEDFQTLPLEQLAARTGLTPPASPSPEEEKRWRAKAYQDYRIDLDNAGEWGNARQGDVPEPQQG